MAQTIEGLNKELTAARRESSPLLPTSRIPLFTKLVDIIHRSTDACSAGWRSLNTEKEAN